MYNFSSQNQMEYMYGFWKGSDPLLIKFSVVNKASEFKILLKLIGAQAYPPVLNYLLKHIGLLLSCGRFLEIPLYPVFIGLGDMCCPNVEHVLGATATSPF